MLRKEQWFILLLAGLVVAAGLGWGLPNRQRAALLTAGLDLSPAELKAHYQRLQPRGGEVARSRVWELSPWQKYQNFWDYVLYSGGTDEWRTYGALAAMKPAELDFRLIYRTYGGGFVYSAGAALMALKLAGLVEPRPDSLFYLRHPEEMARLYLGGRSLAAAAFLGALVVLGLWGNLLGSRAAGSLAMAAYALSPLALATAWVTKPHAWAAFWGVLGLFLLYRRAAGLGRGWQAWAGGAALGLAAGSSLAAAGLALPAALVGARRPRELAAAGLAALAVFAAFNPYFFLELGDYVRVVGDHAGLPRARHHYLVPELSRLSPSLRHLLWLAYSPPWGLLALAGLAWALARGGPPLRRLALGLAGLVAALCFVVGFNRISMFIGPFLCLLAGVAAARGLAGRRRAVAAAAVGAGLLPGLVLAGQLAWAAAAGRGWEPDVALWLAESRPGPGEAVGIMDGSLTPNVYPPFPFLRLPVVNLRNHRPGRPAPEWVMVSSYGKDLQAWERHPLRPAYRRRRVLGRPPNWVERAGLAYPTDIQARAWLYRRIPAGRPAP